MRHTGTGAWLPGVWRLAGDPGKAACLDFVGSLRPNVHRGAGESRFPSFGDTMNHFDLGKLIGKADALCPRFERYPFVPHEFEQDANSLAFGEGYARGLSDAVS